MGFCLIKELANKFKAALVDGTIDPEKLSSMSSEDRHDFFANLLGEDQATKVNSLYESKLLLKDQQTGLINWAKQLSGIKPDVRNDLITRIEKMTDILSPGSQDKFMADLAETRLGTKVTFEEAQHITDISKQLTDARKGYDVKSRAWTDSDAREQYGAARVAMQNYLGELKNNAKPGLRETFEESKIAGTAKAIKDISSIAKSMRATLDDSAVGRQMFKTIFTDPEIWAKNTVESFSNLWKQMQLKGTDNQILDGIKASVATRPYAMDGSYQRAGVALGLDEEPFPSTLPEKIPVLGRFFKASETAFKGMVIKARADIADKYFDIAKANGVDIRDKYQAQSIGKIVNSITGRGSLNTKYGNFETIAEPLNSIFFSPRMLKSNIDILTGQQFDDLSDFAQKKAAMNSLKVIAGLGTGLAIAHAFAPKSVELDPRSADFGKIKIGDTRIDVTGGAGSIATLAARLISHSSKSSTSGKISQLGNKFGQTNATELIGDFAENKLSPAASLIKDLYSGQDFAGNPTTLKGEIENTVAPFPVTNAESLMNDPKAAPLLLGIITDALGFSNSTYAPTKSKLK